MGNPSIKAEPPHDESRCRKIMRTGEWQKAFRSSELIKPRGVPHFFKYPKPIATHKIKLLMFPSKPWLTLPGCWRKNSASSNSGKRRSGPHWSLIDTQGIRKDRLNTFSKPLIVVRKELLDELKKEAEMGSSEAQYAIAECCRLGIGFPLNPSKAFHYCQMAAIKGLADAQMMLGRFLEDGFGCTQSFEMAYKYYLLASEQKNQSAKTYLQLCCELEIDFESIPSEIFRWYDVSADENDRLGINFFSSLFKEHIDTAKTEELAPFYNNKFFTLAKTVANEGLEKMQLFVGLCYAVGRYEKPSIEQCYHYLNLAAEKNCQEACLLLGAHFALDSDQKIKEKAMYHLQRLADQGNATAQLFLGQVLLEQNQEDKAAELFSSVIHSCNIEQVRATSNRLLGVCYEKGIGREQSPELAYIHYDLAAREGDVEAIYRLGKAYVQGDLDLPQDVQKGFGYYLLAAEQDHEEALIFLAEAYDQGIGVEKSLMKAGSFAQRHLNLVKFRGRNLPL